MYFVMFYIGANYRMLFLGQGQEAGKIAINKINFPASAERDWQKEAAKYEETLHIICVEVKYPVNCGT